MNWLICVERNLQQYFVGSWYIDRKIYQNNELVVSKCVGIAKFYEKDNDLIYEENVQTQYNRLNHKIKSARSFKYDFDHHQNGVKVQIIVLDSTNLSFIVNFIVNDACQLIGNGNYQCNDDLYCCEYIIPEANKFILNYNIRKKNIIMNKINKQRKAIYVDQKICSIFSRANYV